MKLMTDARKALLAGIALAACLGFTLNAQAQTCVISNWDGAPTGGLTDSDAGTQDSASSSNRRYGGPCGLRVDYDGSARYVTDTSPDGETTYNVRFYVYLDNAGGSAVQLFGADDGTDDQIQVWYNVPGAGDLTLRVFDTEGSTTDLEATGVSSGWHSVEFAWQQNASADIRFNVDGSDNDITATVDTTDISVQNAHLGVVNDATGPGEIDFDDFDSRRIDRPGRLCRGLTDPSRDQLALDDVNAVFAEFSSNGGTPAGGQPDYNEDGSVDLDDVSEIFSRFASGNEDCSLNS